MRLPPSAKRPAQLLVLAGASYFVFWACAPMMSAPPSTPMPPPVTRETGHGAMGGLILSGDHPPSGIGSYQFWLRTPAGIEGLSEKGLVVQAGFPTLLSAGWYHRFAVVSNERAYLGAQVAAGILWGEVAVPAAVKVGDKVWLTTQPSYKHQFFQDLHIPVGMSWEMGENGRLDAEVGAHFLYTSMVKSGYPNPVEQIRNLSNFGPYIGIGYARQFGATP